MISPDIRRRLVAFSVMALAVASMSFPRSTFAMEPQGEITLGRAVEAALKNHPRLQVLGFERTIAEARLLQASKLPNPEIEVEVGGLGGSAPFMDRVETIVTYSQTLERGKQAPRIRRGEAERALVDLETGRARLDLVADVRKTFTALQAAQQKEKLVGEALRIAEGLKVAASERVVAGVLSPIEETRADVALTAAQADVARAKSDVEASRISLSEAIGETIPSFGVVAGSLSTDALSIKDERAIQDLSRNPDLSRFELERTNRQAALDVERSLAQPDVTLKGGVAWQRDESVRSVFGGFSIPLPFNDRNEGAIRESQARLAAVGAEQKETEARLAALLQQRLAARNAAAYEAKLLSEKALPGAKSAYEAVEEGFRLGKFRYLDVLDAGKTLIETRLRHLSALTEFHIAAIDVDRLVAQLPAELSSLVEGRIK